MIATVTQIENIYWDLVSAYEQARVNEQSLAFAQQSLDIARKQLKLEAIPELDVTRAEAEVSRRDQDLTIARTNLQLQESLIKNALTKSLDDPVLEEMPVIPTDRLQDRTVEVKVVPILDLIQEALRRRAAVDLIVDASTAMQNPALAMPCCRRWTWLLPMEEPDWPAWITRCTRWEE